MGASSQQSWENLQAGLQVLDYSSNALQLFTEGLGRRQDVQILDVGPVCGDNVKFLAERVWRLYICDMFLHLDQQRRKGLPSSHIWTPLDHPPKSLDGILMWDLIDHLKDREIGTLARLCHRIMKPGGMLLVFVRGEQVGRSGINAFVIGDSFQLHLRPQTHLDLPLYFRTNREILAMLSPFKPVRTFLYKGGFREFLFRRD